MRPGGDLGPRTGPRPRTARERAFRCARGLAPVLALAAMLAPGCRPAAPAAPSPPPTSSPRTDPEPIAPPPAGLPAAGLPAAGLPAAGLPDTCTLELAMLVPSAKGHGASEVDFAAAKEAAWVQACAELRKTADLDCRDPERVAPVSERSSSMFSSKSAGVTQQRWEYDVVLGARRTAEGFGDAPGDRQEACRRARAHACERLVGGPCPESGVRVISIDGKPPSAAAVEPVPEVLRPRETI